jgi:hypothetical protein
MSTHKHHENIQRIKDEVTKNTVLSESEKSDTIKRLEEWIAEDKAEGIIFEELLSITNNIRPILVELGLI